jgi:uncharacterized protein YbjT (DUF2867 family)
VSYRDVAEFAVRSHLTPGARNRILEVGGPQDLSPLEVVGIFEKVSGAPFERQFVPEAALLAQLESANDPLAETFAKLQLEYVHGCPKARAAAALNHPNICTLHDVGPDYLVMEPKSPG